MRRQGTEKGCFNVLTSFQPAISQSRVRIEGETAPLRLADGLERGVRLLQQISRESRKVVLVGNGGSAAIASHQAVDLWRNAGLKALSFNEGALLTCIANDFGYPEVFSRPIRMFCEPGDLLIAISSSGRSANILRAVESARAVDCRTMTFSGFDSDNPLDRLGEINFYVPSRSYGVVEAAHLLLLHAIVDEYIQRRADAGEEIHVPRDTQDVVLPDAPHPAD